jgi:serine/threonine protein kinase
MSKSAKDPTQVQVRSRHILSPTVRDLVDRMLQIDTSRRLTLEQCLAHDWFSKQQYFGMECFYFKGKKGVWDVK